MAVLIPNSDNSAEAGGELLMGSDAHGESSSRAPKEEGERAFACS